MSAFSGFPTAAAASSPQQSAGSEQQSELLSSQQSFVASSEADSSETGAAVDDLELSELLLKAPQPVSSENAASINTILALLFIFITFQI